MFLDVHIDEAHTPSNKDGIVYILDLDVDDIRVVKIGVTTRKVEDRVLEILLSYWKTYRVFPRCYPKRFKRTTNIYEKEKLLLDYFSDCKFECAKQFSGYQELVYAPLEDVVEIYEKVINGEVLEGRYRPVKGTDGVSDTFGEFDD